MKHFSDVIDVVGLFMRVCLSINTSSPVQKENKAMARC